MSAVDYLEDCSFVAGELGIKFARDPSAFATDTIDVVVFAVAIVALREVLADFPMELLENKLVVDVLSVKCYPKAELSAALPASADLLCTHPMFGLAPLSPTTSFVCENSLILLGIVYALPASQTMLNSIGSVARWLGSSHPMFNADTCNIYIDESTHPFFSF